MMPPSDSIARQTREMARRLGRPLRVLHLGNIANNAFRNAAVQRSASIEADVVAWDYYHVMGCPEWEQNTLTGEYDAFAPDWWKVGISGPTRPEWYVQGPRALCQAMLRARQGKSRWRRLIARLALIEGINMWLSESASAKGIDRPRVAVLARAALASTRHLAPELDGIPTPLRFLTFPAWMIALYIRVERMSRPGWRGEFMAASRHAISTAATRPAWLRSNFRLLAGVVLASLLSPLTHIRSRDTSPSRSDEPSAATSMATIMARHRALFPDLPEEEHAADIAQIRSQMQGWEDILPHYDIVQGYSLDGIIPLGLGHKAFTTYEHGTLREIPFEPSSRGRLCWLTYASAPFVFVTNSDVLPSVDRMAITPERAICLPHAFDDSGLVSFQREMRDKARPAGPPHFFAPARHHWQSGGGSWEKGNDVYLNAAGQLHAEGRDFRLTLIDWGEDAGASRALIERLGFTGKVTWLPIQNREAYWRLMCEAHCVIDQFSVPAIGGVSYEALTLGCRVITRIDGPVLARFFGAAPPLLVADGVDEVVARMRAVLDDPEDVAGTGEASASWAAEFHSTERLTRLQLDAYEALLSGAGKTA